MPASRASYFKKEQTGTVLDAVFTLIGSDLDRRQELSPGEMAANQGGSSCSELKPGEARIIRSRIYPSQELSGTGPLAGLDPPHEHRGWTDWTLEAAASVPWMNAVADEVSAWLWC